VPLFNLRAVCKNNNGASATYTWRAVELASEAEAHRTALAWASHQDSVFRAPDAGHEYQLASIETSLPTDVQLKREDDDRAQERMWEYACYSPNDY
jgi:hypothetical protein